MNAFEPAPRAARFRFNPNLLHRPLNLVLLLGGCLLAGTGWVMDARLPRGRAGHGLTLFGLGRHDWAEVHAWTGYAVVALVALHLAAHAGWLRRVAAHGHTGRLVVGLGAGAAVIAFFAFAPVRG